MTIEFQQYPKTPRLLRDIVITEKLDGTNAGIQIIKMPLGSSINPVDTYRITEVIVSDIGGVDDTGYPTHEYWVVAQSRNRIILPESDNQGFAKWVKENASTLVEVLGEGTHFGEWYGVGIQGNPHQITGKRFALFNTHRWGDTAWFEERGLKDVHAVSILYHGPLDEAMIKAGVDHLRVLGSNITPGAIAEGVVIYYALSR